MEPYPFLIDLSHHNVITSLAEAKQAGVIGVLHKATQGTGYVDETFAARRQEAAEASLPFVSYHFLEAGQSSEQMQHYLDTVMPVPGERMVIDHEADATIEDLIDAVNYLRRHGNTLQLTIYSGHTIKEQVGTTSVPALAETSLWIAQYTAAATPEWPSSTWPTWSLWQYTDQATVPGVGIVDGNYFNGNEDAARRWLLPAPIDESRIARLEMIAYSASGRVLWQHAIVPRRA